MSFLLLLHSLHRSSQQKVFLFSISNFNFTSEEGSLKEGELILLLQLKKKNYSTIVK
jgi:hypothetical protein